MKKFWIVNKVSTDVAQILIYGYISPYDVSAAEFLIELSLLAKEYKKIELRINSGGGSIFEGIAIFNTIKTYQRSGITIDTYVDGIAGSMAGVIAIAGSKVHMSKYGRIMTHKAQGAVYGDVDDIREYADLVESTEDDIAKIFATRTGLTAEKVKEKFLVKGVDKWLKADECVTEKLADDIYDADPVTVPEDVTDEKELTNIFETCLNKTIIPQNSYTMKKELLAKLGLPENATADQIDAAVEAALAKKETAEAAIANHGKDLAETIVDQAITDKKLVAGEKEQTIKAFAGNIDGLKMFIGKLTPAVKPADVITPAASTTETTTDEDPEKMTWDVLMKNGAEKMNKFMDEHRTIYNRLFKAEYGFEPTSK